MKKFLLFVISKLKTVSLPCWAKPLLEILSKILTDSRQESLSEEKQTAEPEQASQFNALEKKKIAISSGHGKYIRGAKGIIDEVDEARRVTDRVAQILRARGHECVVFHDDVSRTVDDNLNAIVNWHREQDGDRDALVHFNAWHTPDAHGTEAIFRDVCDKLFVAGVAESMSKVGFRLRPAQNGSSMQGAVQRSDLRVLNSLTDREKVLIEVCFVTSPRDVQIYAEHFESLCKHIADALAA